MNLPDAPLPPWARKIQQAWIWQVIGLPVLVGFGGALVANGCLSRGLFDIDPACLKLAISSTVISLATVLISGHSPGSASFKSDGTVNTAVLQTAAITK